MGPPEPGPTDPDVLRITSAEVASAAVPPAPLSRPTAPPPPPVRKAAPSQLAIASLVIAGLGIPLPGLVLGPIAAVCGALALARLDGEERRGFGLAIAGLCLGVIEFVAWGVGLSLLLLRPAAVVQGPAPLDLGAEPQMGISEAPPVIRRALRANVRVVCAGLEGGEGSGVVVRRGADTTVLLTSRHVVRCAEDPGHGRIRVTDGDGHGAEAKIHWVAPEGVDLAVVEAAGLAGTEEVALQKHLPRVGDAIFVVGNPLGLPGSLTRGTVSALRTSSAGSRTIRVVQLQASVNPGNSGGGVYGADGSLLGVVTWMANKREGEGIGFAITVDEVVDLLHAQQDLWKEVSDR